MTPVYQTIFTAPGGNCFQACVASVCDCALDEVPHFFADAKTPDAMWTQEHWERLQEFGKRHKLRVSWVDPDTEPDLAKLLRTSGLFYIAFGDSPRHPKAGHAVVMHKGHLVHDPVPHGAGIASAPWLFVVFLTDGAGA